MFDLSTLRNNNTALQNDIMNINNNKINGLSLDDYIYKKILTRVDPIEYCHEVLRSHLPEKRKYLHENQVELIRAVCNPRKYNAA